MRRATGFLQTERPQKPPRGFKNIYILKAGGGGERESFAFLSPGVVERGGFAETLAVPRARLSGLLDAPDQVRRVAGRSRGTVR